MFRDRPFFILDPTPTFKSVKRLGPKGRLSDIAYGLKEPVDADVVSLQ